MVYKNRKQSLSRVFATCIWQKLKIISTILKKICVQQEQLIWPISDLYFPWPRLPAHSTGRAIACLSSLSLEPVWNAVARRRLDRVLEGNLLFCGVVCGAYVEASLLSFITLGDSSIHGSGGLALSRFSIASQERG